MKSASPKFSLDDFAEIIKAAGDSLVVIGGQAVAWWAKRYEKKLGPSTLTSRDIDFWADRIEMEAFAAKIQARPKYPHRYEMTVLSGIVSIRVKSEVAAIEFLHTVPGLDEADPESAAVRQKFGPATVSILDPVSLMTTKVHALRNFDQEDRQDLLHLQVCVATAREFITEILRENVPLGLWYCERVIRCATKQNNVRVARKHQLDLLSAIPIVFIRKTESSPGIAAANRTKLNQFLKLRWSRLDISEN